MITQNALRNEELFSSKYPTQFGYCPFFIGFILGNPLNYNIKSAMDNLQVICGAQFQQVIRPRGFPKLTTTHIKPCHFFGRFTIRKKVTPLKHNTLVLIYVTSP